MSIPASQLAPDHAFTDFIACEVCWRDYTIDNQLEQIPFWVTSCAHICCNDHIDPNKCAKCGTLGIQLERFGPNLSSEISAYFASPSESMATLSRTMQYQQQYLFNTILFFKDKVLRQKGVLTEVRGRLEALGASERRIEELEMEVARLRSQLDHRPGLMGPPSLPGSSVDGEGRNRIRDVGMHSDPIRRAPSSTGSLSNVLPPHRVSLQPSKRNPSAAAVATVASHVRDPGPEGGGRTSRNGHEIARPATALAQFAYNPNRRATATPVHASYSDADAYQQQEQQHPSHQVVQLPPRNPSRLGHVAAPPAPSPRIPPRSQAPSRLAHHANGGGGGGPSIRAMTTPTIQHRPTSVVHTHRHSFSSHPTPTNRFPPAPPQTPQPNYHNQQQNALPQTPRPSTTSRMPFYPNGGGAEYGQNGAGGGGRPSSRMQLEEYDFDQNGGLDGGGGGGYGYGGGGGMGGRGYMPR